MLESPEKKVIGVPASMAGDVAECLQGCYDVPGLEFSAPPIVILDIGANVGAFTLWASKRWGGSTIHAYEPNPDCLELLSSNVDDRCIIHPAAVSSESGSKFLYDGAHNCGEASLVQGVGTRNSGRQVNVISGADLPLADIIKIDTEGSEWDILSTYPHLDHTRAVMFEWHSLEAREKLTNLLTSKGYVCVADKRTQFDYLGLMIWKRTENKPEGIVPHTGIQAHSVNLLIACPAYGGLTYVSHNSSIISLIQQLNHLQVKHELRYLPNESLIPRARNYYANRLLDGDPNGQPFTHLLFLDVDIGFGAQDIISLLALDKDIAALPYTAKGIEWWKVVEAVKKGVTDPKLLERCCGRPIINAEMPTTFNVTDAVRFPQLGTGVLLIKRKVFEKMAEDPERKYKLMNGEKDSIGGIRDYAYDFFQIGINKRTRYYDSEDYRFCLDANELGFETWLWPLAVTSHTGTMTYWLDIPYMSQLGIDLTAKPEEVEKIKAQAVEVQAIAAD
jgi:FkbM family methyltransferase